MVNVVDADGVAERRHAMVPLPRYGNVCKRQYEEGCEYPMVPLEARSRASHNAYFAQVHDAFQNIPESIAARWPTEEHLRKWSLVETGWFNESEIDCADEKAARQTAVLMRSFDDYARISVHGSKVIIRRAKSQAVPAMAKEEFEASKKSVLDLLEHMTGVPRGTFKREAGRHA